MKAYLYRKSKDEINPTLGEIQVGELALPTLEKPWKNNERRISCIPDGIYRVTKETHKKLGKVFRLHGVPDRDGILIHKFNYEYQSLGCISPGLDQKDIDKDGRLDNVQSSKAMDLLWEYDITEIEITTV